MPSFVVTVEDLRDVPDSVAPNAHTPEVDVATYFLDADDAGEAVEQALVRDRAERTVLGRMRVTVDLERT